MKERSLMMTTMELRQSLLQEIASIIDSDELTKKALEYVCKIKAKEQAHTLVAKTTTTRRKAESISKKELLAGIDTGLQEMQRRKQSGEKAKTLDELIDEL